MKKIKNVFAIFGSLMLALSVVFASIPVSAESTLNEATSVRTYEKDATSINVSELTSLDSDKNAQNIGAGKSHSDVVNELGDLEKGTVAAAKNAYFEQQDDAKQGIVRTDLDIADNPVGEPIDVALVLDDSASMNMYSITNDMISGCGGNTINSCCCLADDHYYYVPANTFGNAESFYFNPMDIKGYGRTWKEYASDDEWKAELARRYGTTKRDFSEDNIINNWKPEENHYKKVGDDYVKIDKPAVGTIPSEMYPQGYSPVGNNDGCIDRMMIQKASALELAKNILNANDRNKVSVYTFAYGIITEQPLTRDIDKLESIFSSHYGYGWTNYITPIEKVKTEFASSTQ